MKNIIVVDLDGTLVNSDMLIENIFSFIRSYPLQLFSILIWLLRGSKVNFKRRLADSILPDVKELPYNLGLLKWLKEQRESGADLVLATASDRRIANAVSEHLGIFDEVMGTEKHNLSSSRKRTALVDKFGEKGYSYIGNSHADIAVWKSAKTIHVANPDMGVLKAARKIGVIANVFNDRSNYFKSLLKLLRVHQWSKNLLIFIPLLASHQILNIPLLTNSILAFVAFSLCTSSVYILNDLLDLHHDRLHPSKKNRPVTAGRFPILHACALCPAFLITAFTVSLLALPLFFTVILACYYLLTLAYSLFLKRVVMLDVVILAMLYIMRVLAGAAALSIVASAWILAFCMFLFLSLAFMKRCSELLDARKKGDNTKPLGRNYYPADLELLSSFGGSSGYISVLVLALYINDVVAASLYSNPEWMWAACPLLLFWLSRNWLLAHRGEMHEDPVLFAVKDRVSMLIGGLMGISFWLAV